MAVADFCKDPDSSLVYVRGDAGELASFDWTSSSGYKLFVISGSIHLHDEDLVSPGFELVYANEKLTFSFLKDATQLILVFFSQQFREDVLGEGSAADLVDNNAYTSGTQRVTLPSPTTGDLEQDLPALQSMVQRAFGVSQ